MLALPVIVLSIWLAFDFDPRRQAIVGGLSAVFYFYAAGSLIAYMLEDEFATADELFAAGATFTLLAWAFAYVYLVCQFLLPGSFGALVGSSDPRTWFELLFLSFTTLTGVGLGDIVPLLPMARSLVMIEEFSGVMYLALVVSRCAVGDDAKRAVNGGRTSGSLDGEFEELCRLIRDHQQARRRGEIDPFRFLAAAQRQVVVPGHHQRLVHDCGNDNTPALVGQQKQRTALRIDRHIREIVEQILGSLRKLQFMSERELRQSKNEHAPWLSLIYRDQRRTTRG